MLPLRHAQADEEGDADVDLGGLALEGAGHETFAQELEAPYLRLDEILSVSAVPNTLGRSAKAAACLQDVITRSGTAPTVKRSGAVGVPHFRSVEFIGRFPTSDLTFADDRFPGVVRLTALSPFIPHEDRDSSMPAGMLEFEIVNTTADDHPTGWRERSGTMDPTVACTASSSRMASAHCISLQPILTFPQRNGAT